MENIAKFFKLKEHGTDVKTEVQAGFTTFMTMAYIFVVNPTMLSATGMDPNAVFVATVVSAFIATMAMGLMANYPFALASGMGLNAYFTYSIGLEHGWEAALFAVFIEGIIFILLSTVSFRERIFNSIPENMKHAVSVGLGLFVAFIGFVDAGIVVPNDATNVALGSLSNVTTLLSLIGIFIIIILTVKNVKGAILIGILATYMLGVICQLTGLYVVNPEIGQYSLIPTNANGQFAIMSMPVFSFDYNLISAFKAGTIQNIPFGEFFAILVALLFVDIFDTIGTLIGVSSKAGLLNDKGELEGIKPALLADAIGTTVGGVMGTSTVTTFVESAAGVAAGGRTGLTSVVTALLMLATLFFSPVFSAIPSFAIAPALVVVGIFMFDSVRKVDLGNFEEVVPAFLTIALMPLTYSIATGLMFGFVSFCVIKMFTGKAKEVDPVIYGISIIFLFTEIVMPLLK